MIHLEWTRLNSEKVMIVMQSWQPEVSTKGAVVLVHGLGEHSGRYKHVAKVFNESALAVTALDLAGHGKSGGARGHASYEGLISDINYLVTDTRERFPGVPVFIYGHSMGGALVLSYLLSRKPDLQGAIVTSPGLATETPVSPTKLRLARFMKGILPSFAMANGLDVQRISHDAAVIKAYQSDPLVHDRISAQLGWDLITSGASIMEHANDLTVPLLLAVGAQDGIVSVEAVRRFAEKAPPQLLTFHVWDDLYHETHNEPQKAEVIAFYRDWILNRI